MANFSGTATKYPLCLILIYCNLIVAVERTVSKPSIHVLTMQQREVKRVSTETRSRSRRSSDGQCDNQEDRFRKAADDTPDFAHTFVFSNESKYSMALAWLGENSGKLLVTVSNANEQDIFSGNSAEPSTIYLSINEGKNFTDVTHELDDTETVYVKKRNGLQKNNHVTNRAYLVADGTNAGETLLFIAKVEEEKVTFTKCVMPFTFEGELQFHPTDSDYILAQDLSMSSNLALYLSKDGGKNWHVIKEKVLRFKWSTHLTDGNRDAIFVQRDEYAGINILGMIMRSDEGKLEKSLDFGASWQIIHTKTMTFGMEGEYLYTSVQAEEEGSRYMEISKDAGETWNEAQLPTITEDRFYAILDMSEKQIFMHVDDPEDTGTGTLYTSDESGIIFSESLQQHLYPNYEDLTDFYQVASMRGVYISSQLESDMTIHTMITRDRGGEWWPIEKPQGTDCEGDEENCFLQIHHRYSAHHGVTAPPPLSVENALGIILVHAHVAKSLQMSNPDVFVSDDGGYSWRLSLKGPHHYQIADQGGLLVAVPADTETPKVIKFSTDEGNCWHEYTFTEDEVVFTGLLTEPGNKAMTVAIWGYGADDRTWRTHVIDFEKIITNNCQEADYRTWTPHSDNKNDGCLLGKKETFQRLRQDAWCHNGHAMQLKGSKKEEVCPCTKADYACDYGYYRPGESEICIRDPAFKVDILDICKNGHEEELLYVGYHKIPGDVCDSSNGFNPGSDTVIQDLKILCQEGDKDLIEEEEDLPVFQEPNREEEAKETHTRISVLTVVVLVALSLAIIIMLFIVKKYRDYVKGKAVYRYSMLNQEPGNATDDLEQALRSPKSTNIYQDSSDDEEPIHSRSANNHQPMPPLSVSADDMWQRQPTVPIAATHSVPKKTQPVNPFHDDSDEDLLE